MKSVIILNGECKNFEYLKTLCENADFVICADGGYKHAQKVGINVNLVYSPSLLFANISPLCFVIIVFTI